jgi:DHA2 family multidrug resistance protein
MSSVVSASAQPAAAPLNRPMITLSIMLATLIQTLDSTIANVALPHMQGTLSASQDEITWVLTSYIVAAAIATPLTGWLSDQLGVKRLLAISIGGFTVASALCGMADSLTQIVAARLLQGFSARRWCRCRSRSCSISIRRRARGRPWPCGAWA